MKPKQGIPSAQSLIQAIRSETSGGGGGGGNVIPHQATGPTQTTGPGIGGDMERGSIDPRNQALQSMFRNPDSSSIGDQPLQNQVQGLPNGNLQVAGPLEYHPSVGLHVKVK
jgi:hypothetical protein